MKAHFILGNDMFN